VIIKNINPLGDGAPAALGGKLVMRDEDVDVVAIVGAENAAAVAALLLTQTENWEPIDDEAVAIAEVAIPSHLEHLEAASRATEGFVPDVASEATLPAEEPSSTPDGTEVPPTPDDAPKGRKNGAKA